VPNIDITYSPREEEDKEDVLNGMPNSGTIRKSNRIKNPPSVKLDFFMVNLNQNDDSNFNENFIQFTANFNHQKKSYKNSARREFLKILKILPLSA